MFCDRCGSQLASNSQSCTSCGKAVAPGVIPPARSTAIPPVQVRVRRHIHRLAILWFANGVLRLIGVSWFMLFGSMFFPGLHAWMSPRVWPLGPGWGIDSFFPGSLFSLGIFLGFFGVLHLLLAWGLFERQPWARVLGLMLGILALLRIPFGTALGIYTLWVLAPEESAREYEQLVNSGGQINNPGFSPSRQQ